MVNNRSANSTIKGFLFQFEKTLKELLSPDNNEDTIITVEGIEDVDVTSNSTNKLIQCKYHEEQENYSISMIEKPIIQMLAHLCSNDQEANIDYRLFCYFPNEDHREESISENDIKTFIKKSTPKTLEKYKTQIREHIKLYGNSVIKTFCSKLTIEFSNSLSELRENNMKRLEQLNFKKEIIQDVFHPNALLIVHELAVKKNVEDRKITIENFLQKLKTLDKVLLWKYSKFLQNYKQILTSKRKYLRNNINTNLRLRYFLFDVDSFDNFANTIVMFIKEYLDKFHYKNSKLHISNENIPMFIIANDYQCFQNVYKGLQNKNISANIGLTFDLQDWTEKEFFKDAVINLSQNAIDFRLRLLYIDENIIEDRASVLSKHIPDDLFIINTNMFRDFDLMGCNKEIIDVNNINELKYVLNMVNDYE